MTLREGDGSKAKSPTPRSRFRNFNAARLFGRNGPDRSYLISERKRSERYAFDTVIYPVFYNTVISQHYVFGGFFSHQVCMPRLYVHTLGTAMGEVVFQKEFFAEFCRHV